MEGKGRYLDLEENGGCLWCAYVALSVYGWGIRKGRGDVVCGWMNMIALGDELLRGVFESPVFYYPPPLLCIVLWVFVGDELSGKAPSKSRLFTGCMELLQ